jgi:hypothetical protein
MERAVDGPLDVVGQAGQNLLVIVLAEAVQIELTVSMFRDMSLVLHGLQSG